MKFLLLLLIKFVIAVITKSEIYSTNNNETSVGNSTSKTEQEHANYETNIASNPEMQLRELSKIKICEVSCRGCCLNNLCITEFECKFLFYSTSAVSIVIIAFVLFSLIVITFFTLLSVYEKGKNICINICKKHKDKKQDTPSIEMAEST